jgi:hypothetical protein
MSIQQNFPAISPSLSLNFARSKTLDPRITFTRTSSGTRVNETGLVEVVPANSPRFDHSYDPVSGTVRSLGLLVEEQRTNLFTRSDIEGNVGEDPIGAIIPYKENGQSMLVSNDVFIGPNGLSAKHTKGSQGDSNIGYYGYNHTSGDLNKTHTASLYVYIPSSQASGFTSTTVGIMAEGTGVTNLIPGYADPTLTDRWQRIFATYTPTSANFVGLVFRVNTSAGRYVYTDAWQLEQGSFVTSYMPSSGGSQFTRTADNVSMVGENFSSWYNSTEGTVFLDCTPVYDNSTNQYRRLLSIHNNSGGQTDVIQFIQSEQSNQVLCSVWDGASSQSGFGKVVTSGTRHKVAFAVKENNMNASYDGSISTDDTTCTLPIMTEMDIGSYNTFSSTQATMHINKISYYPRRLTNAQLVTLTR